MGSYKLFDIIGPRMIGPSSSHTAGAARLGNVASRILGNQVRTAEITLYGSFAQTGKGHGTDKAIIAGLLGFAPDDLRIRNAYQEARKRGMEVQMVLSTQEMPHPNTARIRAEGANGLRIDMVGSSPVRMEVRITSRFSFISAKISSRVRVVSSISRRSITSPMEILYRLQRVSSSLPW